MTSSLVAAAVADRIGDIKTLREAPKADLRRHEKKLKMVVNEHRGIRLKSLSSVLAARIFRNKACRRHLLKLSSFNPSVPHVILNSRVFDAKKPNYAKFILEEDLIVNSCSRENLHCGFEEAEHEAPSSL
jgi:hypothetical protein